MLLGAGSTWIIAVYIKSDLTTLACKNGGLEYLIKPTTDVKLLIMQHRGEYNWTCFKMLNISNSNQVVPSINQWYPLIDWEASTWLMNALAMANEV